MSNVMILNDITIPVNDTVPIRIESHTEATHVFIGYTFLLAGEVVTPSAGTITVTGKTINQPFFALPLDSHPDPIDATLAIPELPNAAANLIAVVINTTGIVGADEVRIITTANES